jgi:hypothetical protein
VVTGWEEEEGTFIFIFIFLKVFRFLIRLTSGVLSTSAKDLFFDTLAL